MYYKRVAEKKKEPFADFLNAADKTASHTQRQAQQPQQLEERPGPEIPQRPQQRRAYRGERRRPGEGAEQHINPQFSRPHAQGKGDSRQRQQQAVDRVQRPGEPPGAPPPQTQRAQQVIEQRQSHAQQNGGAQAPELFADDGAHQPPKSRESSPPPRVPPPSS